MQTDTSSTSVVKRISEEANSTEMKHNIFSGDEHTSNNMPFSSDSSITKEGQNINQDAEDKSTTGIRLDMENDQPQDQDTNQKTSHSSSKKTKPWKHSIKKKSISEQKTINPKIEFNTRKLVRNVTRILKINRLWVILLIILTHFFSANGYQLENPQPQSINKSEISLPDMTWSNDNHTGIENTRTKRYLPLGNLQFLAYAHISTHASTAYKIG